MSTKMEIISRTFNVKIVEVTGQALRINPGFGGYQLQVDYPSGPTLEPGMTVCGSLHAVTPQLWTPQSGGRFIEPLRGRPYRLQGTVAAHLEPNGMLLDVGIPVHVAIDGHQRAAELPIETVVHCYCRPPMTFRSEESP